MVRNLRNHPNQAKMRYNCGESRKDKMKNLCRYCLKNQQKRHLCADQYIYEHILEPFFKGIYLDTSPICYLDLYQQCKTVIKQEHLFTESANINAVLYKFLKYYIQDYEV